MYALLQDLITLGKVEAYRLDSLIDSISGYKLPLSFLTNPLPASGSRGGLTLSAIHGVLE